MIFSDRRINQVIKELESQKKHAQNDGELLDGDAVAAAINDGIDLITTLTNVVKRLEKVMLNHAELELIEQTFKLSNDFFALDDAEPQHPMDNHEFCHHMHQIQRLIMVRPTRREHPQLFRAADYPHTTAELEQPV